MTKHEPLIEPSAEDARRLHGLIAGAYPQPKRNIRAAVMAEIAAEEKRRADRRAARARMVRWGSLAACVVLIAGVGLTVVPRILSGAAKDADRAANLTAECAPAAEDDACEEEYGYAAEDAAAVTEAETGAAAQTNADDGQNQQKNGRAILSMTMGAANGPVPTPKEAPCEDVPEAEEAVCEEAPMADAVGEAYVECNEAPAEEKAIADADVGANTANGLEYEIGYGTVTEVREDRLLIEQHHPQMIERCGGTVWLICDEAEAYSVGQVVTYEFTEVIAPENDGELFRILADFVYME